jgi:hypothetical protein
MVLKKQAYLYIDTIPVMIFKRVYSYLENKVMMKKYKMDKNLESNVFL